MVMIERDEVQKETIQETQQRTAEDKFENESDFYKGKELLIDVETYLKSGIHIGTKFKSGDMRRYLFKKRKDGLMVFNIETIDKRIKMVAKMLSKYEGKDIAVVCRKLYGHQPTKKFAGMIGAKAYTGRFIPGAFTNPLARNFFEPKVILVCDPLTDSQALKEASEIRIPIISLVGSESLLANVDLVVPANNKGRKSLALIFYLLARETLIERKEMTKETFSAPLSDFEQEIEEGQEERPRRSSFGSRDGRGRGRGGRTGDRRGGSSSGERRGPRRERF